MFGKDFSVRKGNNMKIIAKEPKLQSNNKLKKKPKDSKRKKIHKSQN